MKRSRLHRSTPLKPSSWARGNWPESKCKEWEARQVLWAEVRLAVFTRDGWCCRRCGVDGRVYSPSDGMSVRLDAAHVVPLGMGGDRCDMNDPRNGLVNLVTLCRTCHYQQEMHRWKWADIGVTPEPDIAARWPHLVRG